jgi:bifunctional DNA-binding transcriptional regulator/antitoxin component of YhaV-PrlF toxin-antitoxin module
LEYLAYLTPNGQVTIPRTIMKILGIGAGNNVQIFLEKGCLILKSVEEPIEKDNIHITD